MNAMMPARFPGWSDLGLWITPDPTRFPMAAAHNVAELEARAYKRRSLHRAALDIARRTGNPATRAVNLRIAAGERRALGHTLEELRRWHAALAECRAPRRASAAMGRTV